VGSTTCASAPTSNILIFGRALLGVGAAGLLQGALAIISYAVPLDKVPAYQGIVIGAMGISVCVGPVIGGALTQYATWRAYIQIYGLASSNGHVQMLMLTVSFQDGAFGCEITISSRKAWLAY
jgi:MFS family permease